MINRIETDDEGETKMWISKKRYEEIIKRIADLEVRVQSQPICYKSDFGGDYSKTYDLFVEYVKKWKTEGSARSI